MFSVAQIGFTQSLYTVNEGDGSVEVCVRVLRGELGFPLNFKVSIAGGTATGMSRLPTATHTTSALWFLIECNNISTLFSHQFMVNTQCSYI